MLGCNLSAVSYPRTDGEPWKDVGQLNLPAGSTVLEQAAPRLLPGPPDKPLELGSPVSAPLPELAMDDVVVPSRAFRVGSQEDRLQLGEQRNRPRGVPLQPLQLRASNRNQVVCPVDVGPSQGQCLRGCPQPAIPRQSDDRLPLWIILAYGQNAVYDLAGDELPPVGIATDGNLDLLMEEWVLLDKPLVDGHREELPRPVQVPTNRVVRQPPAEHGRTKLIGVAARDVPHGPIFTEEPHQLPTAHIRIDDCPGLDVRPSRFDVIGGELPQHRDRGLVPVFHQTHLGKPFA
ncbi:MAG: hypothetical protein ABFE13_03380 [Phycisphaerales bacterium]